MVVAKPRGRGNWSPIVLAIEGRRASPLLVRVGQTFVLGGVTWRICEVRA